MASILLPEVREDSVARRIFAELIGTFILVFGGVGSAVLAGEAIGVLGISFAFGLALLVLVYVIGPVSGCHVNPAVTLGLLIRGRIDVKSALAYFAAQIVGAICAAGVLLLVAKGVTGGYDAGVSGLGANGFGAHSPEGYNLGSAFFVEVIVTFFLVVTVLGATSKEAPVGFAGIPIGLVLVLGHLIAIPITNASINPARSIGPAVFVGGWALGQLWVFIVAPLAGALLAGLVDAILREAPPFPARRAERALPSEQRERAAGAATSAT